MINEIMAFKFLSGEIVIAQVLSHDASTDTYRVQNPITINIMPDRAGNPQVAAQPWPQFIADSEKTLDVSGKSLVVKPYPIVDQLRDMYSAQFGGIVLPTKSLII